ncbi:NifB/NifX family molybdenum-iron cluster-binding protein [Candidatus Aminicenantes bacterium AC-708-M15]|jgi:predicted Fe-Mo cluster-binding NifX family protein|nr:NifB/NifX family molybdenum-iron cluster-binding protein [SCandidatus Aminicenantes bacterium Aminicenantia_JdfR_composite]MCP2596472.1 NifB/NifX family molybdenum-iron cluster-binding protein [Candidatus Aminicenantes bacterium AC-335-G13]MCP2598141.1 NifB/NifX family molybdenum-iron cluster-binding protein [Candidatus Aminicenantes bacterium AC-335-L06]MCP2603868.1 NifB/NifX family molybdenum-iron cluster-binding protein [Candidatus Aminicenantes bacterium AC-708-M15]MCP2605904.1 NifB/NifX
MKIAITSSGPDLESPVDPRFGRCAYFIFVDPETLEFEAIENPNVGAPGGAGIQSAQLVANKGVKAVLTGSCGPNAFQTLQAAGIEVIIGVAGTVKDAIQQYKSGTLRPTAQPNVPPHFGMGYGPGQQMGPGWGRGMGRGRMGFGPVSQHPFPPSPPSSPEEEIETLKQHAEFLRQQIEKINRRIKELEKEKK